jgi:hypothetical protein
VASPDGLASALRHRHVLSPCSDGSARRANEVGEGVGKNGVMAQQLTRSHQRRRAAASASEGCSEDVGRGCRGHGVVGVADIVETDSRSGSTHTRRAPNPDSGRPGRTTALPDSCWESEAPETGGWQETEALDTVGGGSDW